MRNNCTRVDCPSPNYTVLPQPECPVCDPKDIGTGHQKMQAVRAWLATRYSIEISGIEEREVASFIKHSPDYPGLMAAVEAAISARDN